MHDAEDGTEQAEQGGGVNDGVEHPEAGIDAGLDMEEQGVGEIVHAGACDRVVALESEVFGDEVTDDVCADDGGRMVHGIETGGVDGRADAPGALCEIGEIDQVFDDDEGEQCQADIERVEGERGRRS